MATRQVHTPQAKGNKTIIEERREYSSEELSNQQERDISLNLTEHDIESWLVYYHPTLLVIHESVYGWTWSHSKENCLLIKDKD